jgi:hypothetical protein
LLILNRRKLITGSAALSAMASLKKARAQQNCSSFYPSAPAPAVALNYNTLYWGEDWNIPNTVAQNNSITAGVNWIPAANASSANYTVNTTGTAVAVSNGNTSGGLYPSQDGGIAFFNGPNDPGNGNYTLATTPLSTQGVINPGFGCWGPNIYVEVYCQFNPSCAGDQGENQWYSPLAMKSQVFPGLANAQQLNIVQNYCGNQGFGATTTRFTFNDGNAGGGTWGTGTGTNWTPFVQDSGWHAFGFSWVVTSATTGVIQPFLDNQPAVLSGYTSASKITVGVGGVTGLTSLVTGAPLCIVVGGPPGTGDNIYTDYYRVWGA